MSLVVYVSGPLTSGAGENDFDRLREAILLAAQVRRAGHTPLLPHVSALAHLVTPESHKTWLAEDLHLLARCDCMLRVSAEDGSNGAGVEEDTARELGMDVYRHPDELPAPGSRGESDLLVERWEQRAPMLVVHKTANMGPSEIVRYPWESDTPPPPPDDWAGPVGLQVLARLEVLGERLDRLEHDQAELREVTPEAALVRELCREVDDVKARCGNLDLSVEALGERLYRLEGQVRESFEVQGHTEERLGAVLKEARELAVAVDAKGVDRRGKLDRRVRALETRSDSGSGQLASLANTVGRIESRLDAIDPATRDLPKPVDVAELADGVARGLVGKCSQDDCDEVARPASGLCVNHEPF